MLVFVEIMKPNWTVAFLVGNDEALFFANIHTDFMFLVVFIGFYQRRGLRWGGVLFVDTWFFNLDAFLSSFCYRSLACFMLWVHETHPDTWTLDPVSQRPDSHYRIQLGWGKATLLTNWVYSICSHTTFCMTLVCWREPACLVPLALVDITIVVLWLSTERRSFPALRCREFQV